MMLGRGAKGMGAEDLGAKDSGAKDQGAKDQGAKDLEPSTSAYNSTYPSTSHILHYNPDIEVHVLDIMLASISFTFYLLL